MYDDRFSSSASRLAFNERRASEVVSAALRWLETNGSAPYFVWLHLFDPHAPYNPPAPFAGRYENPYDGEVAYVDEALGALFEAVGSEPLVVVTADHGEGLGEHGEATHSLFVYDSTLRVPLIVRGAGVPVNVEVEEAVRSVDILPTILELAGDEGACERCQGRSLVPLLERTTLPPLPAYAETYFPRLNLGWSELRSLRSEGFKYIEAPDPELYDVRSDPGETRNLAAENPERLAVLARELQRLVETTRGPRVDSAAPSLDAETLSALRSLGYVSSRNPKDVATGEELPDPKSRLSVWEEVRTGMDALARGRSREAVASLSAALEEDPNLLLARSFLAQAYFDEGRFDEAARESLGVLSEEPDSFDGTLLLGKSLVRLGRVAEARRILTEAATRDEASADPLVELAQTYLRRDSIAEAESYLARARSIDAGAFSVLLLDGKIAMLRGDLRRAETSFREALQSRPYEEDPRVQLGNLLLTQRRLEEAAALFRAGLDSGGDAPEFYLGLGNASALAGRMDEAVPLLEEALARAPKSPMVLNSVGFAYLETGRSREGIALLQRSLREQPDQPELASFLSQATGAR